MSNQEFAPQPFKLSESAEGQNFFNPDSGRLSLSPVDAKQSLAAAEAPAKAAAQATVEQNFGHVELFDPSSKAMDPHGASHSMGDELRSQVNSESGAASGAAKDGFGPTAPIKESTAPVPDATAPVKDAAAAPAAPGPDTAPNPSAMTWETQAQQFVGKGPL